MTSKQAVCILLLFLSLSFSDPGYMRAEVEKQWNISVSDPSVAEVEMSGFFIMNNSYQRVLSLETNGQAVHEGDLIKIIYSKQNPEASNLVYARATVEISYPTHFQDASLPPISPLQSNASPITQEINNRALALSTESSLDTLAAMTEWTNKYITYNISYLGRNMTAEEVFIQRQSVCTGYAVLEAAMLSQAGLNSTPISGYAFQNGSYQPHTWLEVSVGNQTVQADPTFGEAGAISAIHIATAVSWSSPYFDTLNFTYLPGKHPSAQENQSPADLSIMNFSVTPLETRDFDPIAGLNYSYAPQSAALNITISNPSEEAVLLTYRFLSPANSYGQDMRVIAVAPVSSKTFAYEFNKSGISDGYTYYIPFFAQIQGASLNQTVQFSPLDLGLGLPGNNAPQNAQSCFPALALFALFAFLARARSE